MHGAPPPASFSMYPPAPASFQQHNVRRQYVNTVPPPLYPPHGWHSVYPVGPPSHHMQPPPPSAMSQQVVPIAVSPNLSPVSPRSANAAAGLASAVSRIHLLPGTGPGQPGVLQQVRSFLEPDDARSFAAVMQPMQQHGRQQQHARGGSGGATASVQDSGGVRKSGSSLKQTHRSRGPADRKPEASLDPLPSRPNRRRSDGEFPQPVDGLGQPIASHSSTNTGYGMASTAAGVSSALSMGRSWSTAVGSARTSPSFSAAPLPVAMPPTSLSSPALPTLLSEPVHHPQSWSAAASPVPSPALQPPPHHLPPAQLHHPTLNSSIVHSTEHAAVVAFPLVSAVEVSGASGVVDSGSSSAAVAGGGGGGAVQYPGPPKGERRQKPRKERVVS